MVPRKIMNEDNKFPIFCHPICAGSSNSCYSRKNYGFLAFKSESNISAQCTRNKIYIYLMPNNKTKQKIYRSSDE